MLGKAMSPKKPAQAEVPMNEETTKLKERIYLNELRAADIEAQARFFEAQVRFTKARQEMKELTENLSGKTGGQT
jgi:hypothetical protein